MTRVRLSNTEDWDVEYEDQDIRGWDVVDADGDVVGTVDDLIADTDSELVVTIVLDDGREIPAADVAIGDETVYLDTVIEEETEVAPAVQVYSETRIRKRTT